MCLLTELSSSSAFAVRIAELESARLEAIRLWSRAYGVCYLTLRAIAAAVSALRVRERLQSVRETWWRAGCSSRGGLLFLIIYQCELGGRARGRTHLRVRLRPMRNKMMQHHHFPTPAAISFPTPSSLSPTILYRPFWFLVRRGKSVVSGQRFAVFFSC
jgi:hypothetical protein